MFRHPPLNVNFLVFISPSPDEETSGICRKFLHFVPPGTFLKLLLLFYVVAGGIITRSSQCAVELFRRFLAF